MTAQLDARLQVKLDALEQRAEELSRSLSAPDVTADMDRYRRVMRSYSELQPVIHAYRDFRKIESDLAGAKELLDSADDAEMRAMAADEAKSLQSRLDALANELQVLLLPKDPNDDKNVVLEIRAGTGGDEATLFAGELFRMYSRYAEGQGWTIRTTDLSESAVGGIKEAIAIIEGERVYSRLKFESGVHRVQRVPETESQGRVHTSAATVAVLPEAEDVEVDIEDKDLRIDVFCSSGPGGQSVNTTQSAVRITHLPTGLVVQCQDEKSQHKNKARALLVLRARLYDRIQQEQHDEIARERKGLLGWGDRSEKIRTYNFPQNRLTDHRIGLTQHNLTGVMSGDIGSILDALVSHARAERLKQEVEA